MFSYGNFLLILNFLVKRSIFLQYKTIDEAEEARQSLDGCRWPTTNPKSMSIRFVRQDEVKDKLQFQFEFDEHFSFSVRFL